jgi:hypothetical protein
MQDNINTNDELLVEVARHRQRIPELEGSGASASDLMSTATGGK